MISCSKKSTSIDQARDFLSRQAPETGTTICAYPAKLIRKSSPISTNTPMEFYEARKVMGDAFGGVTADKGSSMLNTFLEPMGVLSDDRTKDRQDINAYMLGFFANELVQKGGMIMGLRNNNDGKVVATIAFRVYDSAKEHPSIIKKISEFFINAKAHVKMMRDPLGLPEPLSDKSQRKEFEAVMKKLESVGPMMRDWHKEAGPAEPHWYVGIVASDPATQGKGYCKEAMNLLSSAADECGIACYLECADKHHSYYEKFGYRALKKVSIDVDGISLPLFLMGRACV